ncbi:MAG: M56 family metallopeptidase [Paludisphaera borealis]|uniref:M56 family metallopeptidase n=1 Tax=Paludisphaera borealis TaxID=1387353 RepID=UPI002843F1E9|nr:M56 family metallopeptidase [Paludisphaera borealis]MDR3621740.1 M56 family metallopeptidase [Paludisphaera borealis]
MISTEILNAWGEAWTGAMGRALLDSSGLLVVVLVVWLPLRRRISAQLAHGMFCLVLLRLAVPQALPWPSWLPAPSVRRVVERTAAWAWQAGDKVVDPPVATALIPPPVEPTDFELPTTGDLVASPTEAPPSTAVAGAVRDASPPARASSSTLSPRAWLMIAWGAISLVLLGRFGRSALATRALIRDALPVDPEWMPVDVGALEAAVGVRRPVRWAVSPRLRTPAVGGLFRPTVVLPPDLEDGLTQQQLRWVLLHELAHVRRGDLWVVMAQRLVQSVFFFHPAVHVANWVIDQLREYACDDEALAASQAPRRDCGEGFLTVAGRSVEAEPASASVLGLFESRMVIRRRLVRILDPDREVHARLSIRSSIALFAAAAVVVAFGRTPEASARPRDRLDLASNRPIEPEPAAYRPGEIWHREAAPAAATSSVLAMAYSADGSLLATAGEGPLIVLRDVRTGQVVNRLSGHADAVSCLAFSADGKTLASGGYDATVRLWDVADGRSLAVLEGHANWIFGLAFAPDGKTVASAGHDKSIRLWSVPDGRERAVLLGSTGSVRALAFSADGRTIASGGADRIVTLWDVAEETPRGRLEGHRGTIRALAFAPGGSGSGLRLASAGEDGEVRFWEAEAGRVGPIATLAGHPDMVVCLAFSPGGSMLATGGLDATVKLWNPIDGRERATLRGHHDGVSALAFAPGARQLATAGFDGAVRLWEPSPPAFSPAACWNVAGPTRGLGFSADGRALSTLGAGGIEHWDVVTGLARTSSTVSKAVLDQPNGPFAVSLSGRLGAFGALDGTIRLVEIDSGRSTTELKGHKGAVVAVSFAGDERGLASVGSDGRVLLWDCKAGRALRELDRVEGVVSSLDFSPDGVRLAAGTDRGVIVWGAEGRMTLPPDVATTRASALAFAPDGKTLAIAGTDGELRLIDFPIDGRRSYKNGVCETLAFSPDGRTLASALNNGEIALRDVRSGREIGVLRGHEGAVAELAFSPDGRSIASAGVDGAVKIWNLNARRLTARESLKPEPACPWAVVYSADGSTLAVAEGRADVPGVVTLWDVDARRPRLTLDGHARGVVAVALSPDGATVASGSFDQTVRLWDARTGAIRYVIDGLDGVVTELAFSPDGSLLATAGESGWVTLWATESGEESVRLDGFRGRVQSVGFSPDGRLVAAGGGVGDAGPNARGEVKVWTIADGKALDGFTGHTRPVVAVEFSADGATLATGGLDESLRLWKVGDGRSRLTLSGLPGRVLSLAFAPDGRSFGWSGRNDGLVAVHETSTGAEIARLVGHSATVRDLAFSPDGSTLATAGADRSVKFWDVPKPRN